jgi:PIN domain nuclease of toxin-antitoxin system
LAEVVYLIEKKRLESSAFDELVQAINDPESVFQEVPLTQSIVLAMRSVPREAVPDLPDRIVAATGLHFAVPILSRDGRIRAAQLQTIW